VFNDGNMVKIFPCSPPCDIKLATLQMLKNDEQPEEIKKEKIIYPEYHKNQNFIISFDKYTVHLQIPAIFAGAAGAAAAKPVPAGMSELSCEGSEFC